MNSNAFPPEVVEQIRTASRAIIPLPQGGTRELLKGTAGTNLLSNLLAQAYNPLVGIFLAFAWPFLLLREIAGSIGPGKSQNKIVSIIRDKEGRISEISTFFLD